MQSLEGLPEKEKKRRLKISKKMKKIAARKRKAGLRAYWSAYRKEKAKREKAEKRAKEKEKERLRKEREKQKHKKKRGRKKKRGPKISQYQYRKRLKEKREKANRVRPTLPPPTFEIIWCRNKKREKSMGKFRTAEDAYEKFKKIKKDSDNVLFPRMLKIKNDLTPSIDECILIEKTDSGPSVMRNEYGKLVEQQTDLEGWEILDKFRYNVEETFWVWGYDKKSERKNFKWIYDYLTSDFESGYEFRRVFIFNNKLLIRFDDGSLSMVICKSTFDSVRLYNELQKMANKDKEKQVVFIGDKSELSPWRIKLEDEIIAMTGWTRKKVRMKDTTYYSPKNLKSI